MVVLVGNLLLILRSFIERKIERRVATKSSGNKINKLMIMQAGLDHIDMPQILKNKINKLMIMLPPLFPY